MKNKPKADYSFIVVFLVSVLIIVLSLRMQYFKSKLLPLILAGIILILSVIGFWLNIKDLRKKQEAIGPGAGKKAKADNAEGTWQEKTAALLWIAGYLFSIYLVGLVIAIPVFVFAYMKTHGIKWSTTVIWTILCTVAIYGVFELLLEVELYRGVLIPYLFT